MNHAYARKDDLSIEEERSARRNIAFTLAAILLMSVSRLGIASELSDEIGRVGTAADTVSTNTAEISSEVVELIRRYQMTNGGKCALLIAGTSSTSSAPIYFIPGPQPISALQADISASSITITGITTGPEAGQIGKSVSSSIVPGGRRFLLVGFNQNALIAGTIAIVSYDVPSTGEFPVTFKNVVASDPEGVAVPLCTTSGVITK